MDRTLDCELAVIGTGLSGMAAALFAAESGIDAVLIGETGEITFASGYLDLLGVHPVDTCRRREDPWAAVEELGRDLPDHPYARIDPEDMDAAFQRTMAFLADQGLAYRRRADRNVETPTALGTVKTTHAVPASMWNGVRALEEARPCLMVDFEQLRGFSARQMAVALEKRWPGLRTATIPFPGPASVRYTEQMAMALEVPATRARLAGDILACLGRAQTVGLPAVLGLYRPRDAYEDLQDRIGVPVFEIPTLPPSVPGLRLREAFLGGLTQRGIRVFPRHRVTGAVIERGEPFRLAVTTHEEAFSLTARGIVLATGRFLGGGLRGDRGGIREALFDLPVHQPTGRSTWHRADFLDPRGHEVNRAGLRVDEAFRPLNGGSRPAHHGLFAAGAILAGQDWTRMKCGAGLALSTALGAVNAFQQIGRGGESGK